MKTILKHIALMAAVALIVYGSMWASQMSEKAVCDSVEVRIINDDTLTFITREGILNELTSRGIDPAGQLVSQLDIEGIEQLLDKCDYLENVECYVTGNDVFVIEARQFLPVMRVYDNSDNTAYYVNRSGKRMIADGRYHTDVPVVQGDFSKGYSPVSLLPLMRYVASDPVLDKLVTMYQVKDSNNVYIIPSICGHKVNLGRAEGYESKFKKLLQFYQEVMPVKGWNTYSEITLKWDYQVVGTLREKKKRNDAPYNPEEDEQAPELESVNIPELSSQDGIESKKK